jgi:hypothetical protein
VADARELREALKAFLGEVQFRKFVKQGFRQGRLMYWQERSWEAFVSEHPHYAISVGELTEALRVCHLHGDDLLRQTVEVIKYDVYLDRAYEKARSELFPNASLEFIMAGPSSGNTVERWFCTRCEQVKRQWLDEYKRRN